MRKLDKYKGGSLARKILFDVKSQLVMSWLSEASSCRGSWRGISVLGRDWGFLTTFRVEAAKNFRGGETVDSSLLLLRGVGWVARNAGEALGRGSWGRGWKFLLGGIGEHWTQNVAIIPLHFFGFYLQINFDYLTSWFLSFITGKTSESVETVIPSE